MRIFRVFRVWGHFKNPKIDHFYKIRKFFHVFHSHDKIFVNFRVFCAPPFSYLFFAVENNKTLLKVITLLFRGHVSSNHSNSSELPIHPSHRQWEYKELSNRADTSFFILYLNMQYTLCYIWNNFCDLW